MASDHVFAFFHSDPVEFVDDNEPVLCRAPRLLGGGPVLAEGRILAAVDALFTGPIAEERAAGVASNCGAIVEIGIVKSTVTVRLCGIVTGNGALFDMVLRRQIEQTVFQFAGIDVVELLNPSGGTLFSGQ